MYCSHKWFKLFSLSCHLLVPSPPMLPYFTAKVEDVVNRIGQTQEQQY